MEEDERHKRNFLRAFESALPAADGTVEHRTLMDMMKTLLPHATDDELASLFKAAGASDSGSIRYRDFFDYIFGGRRELNATCDSPQRSQPPDMAGVLGNGFASTMDLERVMLSAPSGDQRDGLDIGSPKSASGGLARDLPSTQSLDSTCSGTCVCGALQGANLARLVAEGARELLPKRIILVRHGESEGNVDASIYRTKPDNALELTDKGSQQAAEVGKRIKTIIGDDKVHMFVSPFQRTLQTSRNIREALPGQVQQVEKDARIREQEFGNLQGDDFKAMREDQKTVGRYFYRFPTGESGTDVFVRVKDWWDSAILNLNLRPKTPLVDTVVVVTHGLTMRYILMQLFMWSVTTFQTVWNAGNCEMWVLVKDDSLPGNSPYVLSSTDGDFPKSTASILVQFNDGRQQMYRLDDYLSIPMPRSQHLEVVKDMLQKQHGVEPSEVEKIDIDGGQFRKYM